MKDFKIFLYKHFSNFKKKIFNENLLLKQGMSGGLKFTLSSELISSFIQ